MKGRESLLPLRDQEIVWIPAVPLPLQGWRTDRCPCGAKFRGRRRKHAYEIHYRREHQRGDINPDTQVGVTRAEARRIYAEVNAGCADTPPEMERCV